MMRLIEVFERRGMRRFQDSTANVITNRQKDIIILTEPNFYALIGYVFSF